MILRRSLSFRRYGVLRMKSEGRGRIKYANYVARAWLSHFSSPLLSREIVPSSFLKQRRLSPRDDVEAVSFYFRVRGALVCYLSSTLTSLLAAIILINISPLPTVRVWNRERFHARVSPFVFIQPSTTLRTCLGRSSRAATVLHFVADEREREKRREDGCEAKTERERLASPSFTTLFVEVFAFAVWLAITVSFLFGYIARGLAQDWVLFSFPSSSFRVFLPCHFLLAAEKQQPLACKLFFFFLLKFQRWMNEEEEENPSGSNCVCSRAQDFFSRSTPRSTRYMAWPGFSAGVTWLIPASSSFSPDSFLLSLSLTRAFFARRIRRETATSSGIYISTSLLLNILDTVRIQFCDKR